MLHCKLINPKADMRIRAIFIRTIKGKIRTEKHSAPVGFLFPKIGFFE